MDGILHVDINVWLEANAGIFQYTIIKSVLRFNFFRGKHTPGPICAHYFVCSFSSLNDPISSVSGAGRGPGYRYNLLYSDRGMFMRATISKSQVINMSAPIFASFPGILLANSLG